VFLISGGAPSTILPSTLHDTFTTSGSDIRTAKKTVLEWFLGACFFVVGGLERVACTAKRSFIGCDALLGCYWVGVLGKNLLVG
jgi:hypothetical protein